MHSTFAWYTSNVASQISSKVGVNETLTAATASAEVINLTMVITAETSDSVLQTTKDGYAMVINNGYCVDAVVAEGSKYYGTVTFSYEYYTTYVDEGNAGNVVATASEKAAIPSTNFNMTVTPATRTRLSKTAPATNDQAGLNGLWNAATLAEGVTAMGAAQTVAVSIAAGGVATINPLYFSIGGESPDVVRSGVVGLANTHSDGTSGFTQTLSLSF